MPLSAASAGGPRRHEAFEELSEHLENMSVPDTHERQNEHEHCLSTPRGAVLSASEPQVEHSRYEYGKNEHVTREDEASKLGIPTTSARKMNMS